MPPATLIVVDMQECFDAASDPNTVIGVTQEILRAKERNSGIILLEYESCGHTHEGYSQLLKGYRRKSRVIKGGDDGSMEAVRAARRRGFNLDCLRVCGVNADCCVAATALGLLGRLRESRIEVVKEACGWSDRSFTWKKYPKHGNLYLV